MPRLPVIDSSNATGKAKELFDGPLAKKQINIFKGMANNGNVLAAFLNFSQGVKSGALTDQEHEIIALTMAALNGCEYCNAAHSAIGRSVGLSEEAVAAARRFQSDEPKHQALINFIKAVVETKGFVKDEELDAFRDAGYGNDAVLEVIGGIAVNTFTNYFNHVNATEIDEAFKPATATA